MQTLLPNILITCAIGGLFFFLGASFIKYSPKLLKNKKQHDALKIEMSDLSIKQINALNKMYENGVISYADYSKERNRIKLNLIDLEMDSIIIDVIPIPKPANKATMLNDLMIVSSAMNDKGEIDTDEFNELVNHALDEKKHIK